MAPTQSKTADWLFVARRERHRLVIWQEDTKVTNVIYNGETLEPFLEDEEYRMFIYKLPTSLKPKETASLIIETEANTHGFSANAETAVLSNGTFFRDAIFPSFHYERSLLENGVRKKYDLEELDYLYSPRTDSTALKKNLFNEK